MRRYLYHATHRKDVESILQAGLVPGETTGVPGGQEVPGVIWLDSEPRGLRKWLQKYHPNDWVILGIKRSFLDRSKLTRSKFSIRHGGGRVSRSTWYTYKGTIPPEAIHVVG